MSDALVQNNWSISDLFINPFVSVDSTECFDLLDSKDTNIIKSLSCPCKCECTCLCECRCLTTG